MRNLFALIGLVTCHTASLFADKVDFARDIRPILSDKCFFCHGPDEENREAGLRLDIKSEAFSERDGIIAIVPGDLDKSESWYRIATDDENDLMPPPKAHKELSKREIDLIKRWIESGAEWTEHWSFIAPQKSDGMGSEKKGPHPIDQFIGQELESSPLNPNSQADRRTLIRRITFDLTGLPPSSDEVKAFLDDKSPDAYAKLVDRLLASRHYGERMALMWLDAARYGDTSVMHADGPRDMWPWRDWVVKAFNDNQPYDQFSIEQIAGDLLPDPSLQQLIASGFNRNHPSSDEGGAIPEELRVSYVADRVKTSANVWLGLSMECAQCHDHKYDPISQKEYYQFYAYFNNTTDPGMQTRKGNQLPFVELVTELEEDKVDAAEIRRDRAAKKVNKIRSSEIKKLTSAGQKDAPEDLEKRLKNLVHYFPLDDFRSRVLVDAVGSGDLLGPKAFTPISDGKYGRGAQLGERFFDSPGTTEIDTKSKFTFSAWIRLGHEKKSGAVFAKMDVKKGHRGYDLWIDKGKPGIHLVNKWPSNALKVVSNVELKPGEWQHVAVSHNGSGKPQGIAIYIDGKRVEHTVAADKLNGTIKADVPFRVGGRSSGPGIRAHVDEIQIYDRVLSPREIEWAQRDILTEAKSVLASERHAKQISILNNHHLSKVEDWTVARTDELDAVLEISKLLSGKTTSMVMEDNTEDEMRMTYILDRGSYDAPKEDEQIFPGTPAALPSQPAEAPTNRLGLANWLFDDEHPLTARVSVNLLWQMLFGEGLVRTPADFGAQGDYPTHPDLLDWLAVDFQESGWDVKQIIRQIVLSETYRRSSYFGPKDVEIDPENRLLARAPRFRLPAEMLRDNALSLSGKLNLLEGGPGVKPYQPPGLWAEVGLGGNPKFVQDKGDKLYRRSLYTYWKRSSPPPAMVIFDAPNRETCVLKRPRTNTPLQALAAMNDVQMMEASRHFAERLLKEGGASVEERAAWAFELATARPPESGELAALLEVYEHGLSIYQGSDEKSEALLSAGDSERDPTLDLSEHAAWAVVASLILNLDEVMTRN